jgi:predicted ATP-grasp superfamily ATP-dependent carboligase
MALLAVAGLSARLMAESAARDGFEVVALDIFGDVDTCAVAARWIGIGTPESLQIDAERLLSALAALARGGAAIGWVAGSGFEGRPDLLAQGAALLPLIGSSADALARVRDPAQFFSGLAQLDIEHPPVQFGPLVDARGWLLKDFGDCGAAHIRPAPAGRPAPPRHYFQRLWPGVSMSATFLANGRDAVLLGINQQIVRGREDRPYVFCGVLGPVPVADDVLRRVREIVVALVPAFGLRGLASLDFLLAERRHVSVLELNVRPPASLGLYAAQAPMAAHVQACLRAELPLPKAALRIEGTEIVFARRPLLIDATDVQWLTSQPQVHDVPCPGQTIAAGHPVCSVSAQGDNIADVMARLRGLCDALSTSLEKAG